MNDKNAWDGGCNAHLTAVANRLCKPKPVKLLTGQYIVPHMTMACRSICQKNQPRFGRPYNQFPAHSRKGLQLLDITRNVQDQERIPFSANYTIERGRTPEGFIRESTGCGTGPAFKRATVTEPIFAGYVLITPIGIQTALFILD